MGATQYATRAMVLTDKAKALFRERRIKNSNTLVSDILWLASAEFGRQRSAGFRMVPAPELSKEWFWWKGRSYAKAAWLLEPEQK